MQIDFFIKYKTLTPKIDFYLYVSPKAHPGDECIS